MTTNRFLFVLLGGLAFSFLFGPEQARGNDPGNRIYTGVYLHDVTKFNQKDGVFDADFELWAKWRGDDFKPEHLKIANASDVEITDERRNSDGDWHTARWRVRGTLRGIFPVYRFPFDKQTLSVELELPTRYGRLAPDLAGSGMREEFGITGWRYEPHFTPRMSDTPLVYHSDMGAIEGEGQPTKVWRVGFEVMLQRPFITAATKLFLPLLVILLVAFVALFIHPKELGVRASVGVTALLACYAFHFAVSRSMPNVSYITLAEKLFLVSYALCATLLCVSVGAKALHERGRFKTHQQLDRAFLFGFPVILILASALFTVPVSEDREGNGGLAGRDADVKDGPENHPASARQILRIGVNRLSSPLQPYPITRRAAYWETLRSEPGGESLPALVHEAPSIMNNSLRFLANGNLEVTWRILPDLKWSDGKPLTAGDLKFALDVQEDDRIETSEVDRKTGALKVLFKQRVAVAMESIRPLPYHVMAPHYEKGGYQAIRDMADKEVTPSAGAYRVVDFEKGKHLHLEANPHFVGGAPSIARVEIRCLPKDEDLVHAFESGQIDMIYPGSITPESANELKKNRPDAVHIRPSELMYFLHPDLEDPLLQRSGFRRALLMAFDRESLLERLFGASAGMARIAHLPITGELPEELARAVEERAIHHDPDTAREMIREELQAMLLPEARIPLIHGKTAFNRLIAERLVEDAAAVGVTLVRREVDNPNTVYRGPHEGLLLIWRTGLRDEKPEKFWNVPRVNRVYDRSFRCPGAFDGEILALVRREERALYPERRDQIRDLLFEKFLERTPILPLFYEAGRIVVDPLLRGWEEGSAKHFAHSVERWYFEAPPSTSPTEVTKAE